MTTEPFHRSAAAELVGHRPAASGLVPAQRVGAGDDVVMSPRWSSTSCRLAKAGTDRGLASLALVALIPLLLVVAVVVRVTSPGCVIYRQVRVGRDGVPFVIFKFRTMAAQADEQLGELLKAQGRADRPLFKVDDDPRVTRVGRFLRRSSIDELPQLWNVVRGDMSLVGPRPQRPAETALYGPRERRRLLVRPGITGLWQVSGRSTCTWEQAVEHDLRYVREWTPLLDALILVRTVPAVVGRQGAR